VPVVGNKPLLKNVNDGLIAGLEGQAYVPFARKLVNVYVNILGPEFAVIEFDETQVLLL